jgi:hypothetical protein
MAHWLPPLLAVAGWFLPLLLLTCIQQKHSVRTNRRLAELEAKTGWIQVTGEHSVEARCQIVQQSPAYNHTRGEDVRTREHH